MWSTPVLHMESTWTIVTYPSYAFWGTALVIILADWMELHVLVILFLSFNRLLPSWQTFVIFSAERPASHQHARLTHFCVFTDKRSLHMHSLQLPSMKKIFFLDLTSVAEEGRLLARAMLWVRCVYVSFQLLRTPCTLTSHRVHCNWTHPALYFELWHGSLAFDLILCRSRLTGFFEGVMDDGDKQNKPTKIFSTNPLIYHKSKIEKF